LPEVFVSTIFRLRISLTAAMVRLAAWPWRARAGQCKGEVPIPLGKQALASAHPAVGIHPEAWRCQRRPTHSRASERQGVDGRKLTGGRLPPRSGGWRLPPETHYGGMRQPACGNFTDESQNTGPLPAEPQGPARAGSFV
jgi:hypothetical protein